MIKEKLIDKIKLQKITWKNWENKKEKYFYTKI